MSIILQGEIDDQHRLIIEIPADVPIGKVEVEIRPAAEPINQTHPLTRDEVRARLKAAGWLVEYTDGDFPDGVEELTSEEAGVLELFSKGIELRMTSSTRIGGCLKSL